MKALAAYTQHTERILARRVPATERYRNRVGSSIRAGDRVMHLGCGWDRNEVTAGLREGVELVGVDPDRSAGQRYPFPFWCAVAENLPFGNSTIDVVWSDYVFEHVEEPEAVMAELQRVVRPGGTVVALTPNRWSYKSLAAAATPHGFHRFAAARLRPDARPPEDVYPTHYRMNSRSVLQRLAAAHGFEVEELTMVNNGPTWFRRMPGIFEIARAYHRLLDFDALAGLRCATLVVLRRREADDALENPTAAAGSSNPLVVRCTACRTDGMEARGDAFVCGRCGRQYLRKGNIVDTLAPAG